MGVSEFFGAKGEMVQGMVSVSIGVMDERFEG